MLLAVLNRVLAPCSKAQLGKWFWRTALYHDFVVRDADLRSQRFWDHMTYLTADRIREAERNLTQHLVQEFNLDLSTVVYDATNFYTWLDTQTPAELAQRGHQKQHREDLKAVGLALLVTTDFNIPLFHTVYPGNRADTQQFQSVTEDLIDRYQTLRAYCDPIALVYDKGNNSETTMAKSPLWTHYTILTTILRHPRSFCNDIGWGLPWSRPTWPRASVLLIF